MEPITVGEVDTGHLNVEITDGNPLAYRENERTTSVTFEDRLYKYQPMGFTVFLNGGTLGGPTPLFAIRVTPEVPTLTAKKLGGNIDDLIQTFGTLNLTTTGANYPADGVAFEHPFTPLQEPVVDLTQSPTTAPPSPAIVPIQGVCAWQYMQEPLFSRYVRTYRGWRGSIIYRVRATSNFTTQGYIKVGLVNGRHNIKMSNPNLPTSVYPAGSPLINDVHDYVQTGWLSLDLSAEKHLEVTVPYQRLFPWYDRQMAKMYTTDVDSSTATSIYRNTPMGFMDTEQYLVFSLSGYLTTQNGAQVQFEFEYMPGPDFEFLIPMYPLINSWTATVGSTSLPTYTDLVEDWHDPNFISYIVGDHNAAPNAWLIVRSANTQPNTATTDGDRTTRFADCVITRVNIVDSVMSQITTPGISPRSPTTK